MLSCQPMPPLGTLPVHQTSARCHGGSCRNQIKLLVPCNNVAHMDSDGHINMCLQICDPAESPCLPCCLYCNHNAVGHDSKQDRRQSELRCIADHLEAASSQQVPQAQRKSADILQNTAQAQEAKAAAVARPSGGQHSKARLQPGSPSTLHATSAASGEILPGHCHLQPWVPMHTCSFLQLNAPMLLKWPSMLDSLLQLIYGGTSAKSDA